MSLMGRKCEFVELKSCRSARVPGQRQVSSPNQPPDPCEQTSEKADYANLSIMESCLSGLR